MIAANAQQPRYRKHNRRMTVCLAVIVVVAIVINGILLHQQFSQPDVVVTSQANNEQANTDSGSNDSWNLTLVNPWHQLPNNYHSTLVSVPGGEKVDKRIYEPLMEMLNAAKKANLGVPPRVVSGYRTPQQQQSVYNDKIAELKSQGYSANDATRQADQLVAQPGYSEHQLGLAVDINGVTYDLYLWLQDNSYKYGFIFRYPGSKSDLTGIAEEVWHYRYVGIDVATAIYQQNLCLEEYLDAIS